MDNASNTGSGIEFEDGAEPTFSTGARGAIETPIVYIAKLHCGILSILCPADKGMESRIASTIGSNSKVGAQVSRPAIIGNAIQVAIVGSGQTRRRVSSIGTSFEGVEHGLLACRSYLVDRAQI